MPRATLQRDASLLSRSIIVFFKHENNTTIMGRPSRSFKGDRLRVQVWSRGYDDGELDDLIDLLKKMDKRKEKK